MKEDIFETKVCKQCKNSFHITDLDMRFYEKASPLIGGEKQIIPPPTLCFECRRRRRKAFRNEGKLYKRKCDATGKDIISIYSEDKKIKVYNNADWWKNDIVPEKGGDIQLEKPFFEMFRDLMFQVPFPATYVNQNSINSDFGNHTGEMKDCYLTFGARASERVYYGCHFNDLHDCMDVQGGLSIYDSYQVIGSESCHSVYYVMNSSNCSQSSFLFDCQNCEFCFMCYNLRSKKYHIFNQEYSKDIYEKKVAEIRTQYLVLGWKAFDEIIPLAIKRNLVMFGCENSYGDTVKNIKNCSDTYFMEDAQDCKYIENGAGGTKDTYDGYGIGVNLALGYEIVDSGENATYIGFTLVSHNCPNSYYVMSCFHSSHLFGCIGLRNKQYCIFNKQYTKEEYEILVPKIIAHMKKNQEWGEFFPGSIAPFGYNESVAQEYYYLKRSDALALGFTRSNYELPFPKVEKIIPASKLPDDISKIPDDILNWAIECEVSKKPFRIIKQELEYYRKHDIPIPHLHPEARHLERLHMRNPRKLFDRKCDKCNMDMKTSYPPGKIQKVYCESCYNKEIY